MFCFCTACFCFTITATCFDQFLHEGFKCSTAHSVFVSVQIVLTEMYSDGFHRSFCDDDEDLEIIQEGDSIFAFETPELFRPDQIRSKRSGTAPCLSCNSVYPCCCEIPDRIQVILGKCTAWNALINCSPHEFSLFARSFQGAHMLFSIRTTWSMPQTLPGCPHRYKSLSRHRRAPTRTAGRLRRLCCWCATEPAPDSRAAGITFLNTSRCFNHPLHKCFLPNNSCNSCRFGNPFILYLERTVAWDTLQKEILEKMRHLLRPGVFVQVLPTFQNPRLS